MEADNFVVVVVVDVATGPPTNQPPNSKTYHQSGLAVETRLVLLLLQLFRRGLTFACRGKSRQESQRAIAALQLN